jgi:uncharacterized protein (TIGR03083 family)
MADAPLLEAIATERRELAELLGGLPSSSWDTQTLCAGWRVREVVAHMTMPFRYSTTRFFIEVMKARGNFNRMADRCARRDATVQPGELVATLRDNERNPWKPPGGGFEGALTHDVIHGLDITVALGIDRRVPDEDLRIVLATITKPKSLKSFGADLNGIELRGHGLVVRDRNACVGACPGPGARPVRSAAPGRNAARWSGPAIHRAVTVLRQRAGPAIHRAVTVLRQRAGPPRP